jgi:anti-sigma factor RsiW
LLPSAANKPKAKPVYIATFRGDNAAAWVAPRPPLWRMARGQYPGVAVGLALAASVALVVLPRRPQNLAVDAVTAHIRALQPGHLMEFVSTDRHTVKPWFAGRLDDSPPVRDFAGVGFPLNGGRLDYVGGRAVAALIYGRALHVIDVTVWPGATVADSEGTLDGYNYMSWSRDGMVFWAVSDVSKPELRAFAGLWK